MKYRVRLLRRAQRDLMEIHRYLVRDSPETAQGVVVALLGALDSLDELALRGAMPRDETLRRLGFRYRVVAPRLIFYKVVGREVRVYRVLHGKRAYQDLL